jgi:dual specificity MAP kinase phosphatase
MPHFDHPNADPAFEYDRIAGNVFIGTNACCQGHFEKMLLEEGISADVSLEGEMVDHPYGVRNYVWLPTPDHAPPSLENVRVGVAALEAMLKNGQKAYLHCKNGHGRAPTFYAAYLILKEGLSPEVAVSRIKAKRPGVHLEPPQTDFLRSLTGL